MDSLSSNQEVITRDNPTPGIMMPLPELLKELLIRICQEATINTLVDLNKTIYSICQTSTLINLRVFELLETSLHHNIIEERKRRAFANFSSGIESYVIGCIKDLDYNQRVREYRMSFWDNIHAWRANQYLN